MPMQLKTCVRKSQDDEYYTRYRDCVKELHKYDLRGKKIICPCDTKNSNIYTYLKDCDYNVEQDSKGWENIDYSKYDLVITNPPFSSIRKFIRHLVKCKIDFIMICSDVLRWEIEKRRVSFGIDIYKGCSVNKFIRPDGSESSINCKWIASFQDNFNENYILKEVK